MDHLTTPTTAAPDWVPAGACTLPTVERPLRLAEFDDLFTALESVSRTGDTQARLLLTGDRAFAVRTQRLTEAETSCCSFFGFGVSTVSDGVVALDVEVPPAYADVLTALVARAETRGAAGS